jgi:hypothetical protein
MIGLMSWLTSPFGIRVAGNGMHFWVCLLGLTALYGPSSWSILYGVEDDSPRGYTNAGEKNIVCVVDDTDDTVGSSSAPAECALAVVSSKAMLRCAKTTIAILVST